MDQMERGIPAGVVSLALPALVALILVSALLLSFRPGPDSLATPTLTKPASLPPCVQSTGIWSPQPQLLVYDARRNLRLSYHFGTVFLLRQGPYSLLTALQNLVLFRRRTRTIMPSKLSDTVFVVNSAAQAKVLLERHGATYSSRGPSIAAGKYLSSNRRIVLLPYGAQWRTHHKALVQLLLKDKIQHKWRKALQHEALVLVTNLASLTHTAGDKKVPTDTKVLDEVSRFTASSVLQIAYARRATNGQDPVLKDLDQVSRNIADAFAPRNNLVEMYPILDWLPTWLAPWKSKLLKHHLYEAGVYSRLVDEVEHRLTSDQEAEARPLAGRSVISVSECCAAELLHLLDDVKADEESGARRDLDRKDIAYICATVFEAGAETTAMTINTFLLAAALYPTVIRRAQAEVDEAMGCIDSTDSSAEIPGFAQLDKTPYVCALVKECLRLTPTGSSGVAHTSSRTAGFDLIELRHQGESSQCIVPAGATILPNIYGIHHDPSVFSQPWQFNPDRFLTLSSNNGSSTSTTGLAQDHHAFGFGRRICPGLDLASNSLYIAIIRLLWTFDFHIDTITANRIATEVRSCNDEQRDRFYQLYPHSPTQASDVMDSLPLEQLLLDAYTNHTLSKTELASCISLSVRDPRRTNAIQHALAEIHTAL